MLSTIAEVIRDLLIFVGVIAALLIALVVAVSKMPEAHTDRAMLSARSYVGSRSCGHPVRTYTGNRPAL